MKMLKKMAALLLVGVMALALLTACGDEAPAKSTAEQAEDAMTIAINQSLEADFKNDETLKNLARKAIADRWKKTENSKMDLWSLIRKIK